MFVRGGLRARLGLRSLIQRISTPEPKPLVLMYHRIADEPIDYWGLAVSPGNFQEQLRVVRSTRQALPLAKFVRKLMAGTLPRNAVALTFDDGYVDNLIAGKPRLDAADVPATFFLATGSIDRSEEFWWDELARLILLGNCPHRFELSVRGTFQIFDFGADSPERIEGSTTRRHVALRKIWQTLRCLGDKERRSIMVKIRTIFAGNDHHTTLGRAMTSEEVRALVSDDLVTIGAHTVTHPMLSGLETADCRREILESKRACEALVGAPIAAFAYPYGDFDSRAREVVKQAGFAFACSTHRGPASTSSDIFALPRVQVCNVDGDAFERILRSSGG